MKFGVEQGSDHCMVSRRKCVVAALAAVTLVASASIMRAQSPQPPPSQPVASQAAPSQAAPPQAAAAMTLPPLTDDQAKALKKQEQAWRKTLKECGFNDKDTQGAIIQFADERYVERLAMLAETNQLITVLHDPTVPTDEVRDYEAGFRKAVAEERARRASADVQTNLIQEVNILDQKVGFTKNPRLEAALVLMGLLGDEAQYAGYPPIASLAAPDPDDRPNPGNHSGGHHRGGGGAGGGGMGGPF